MNVLNRTFGTKLIFDLIHYSYLIRWSFYEKGFILIYVSVKKLCLVHENAINDIILRFEVTTILKKITNKSARILKRDIIKMIIANQYFFISY